MQETPASLKATILKAGYVLAPILLITLVFYDNTTDFIPAGYYDDYIFDWALTVLAVQIVVLIWVRKLPALVSLIMSILVSFIVFFADGVANIGYLGFAMANSPLEKYRDRCITVPYFDGRVETLGYCQTIHKAGQLFQEDIMMDSGGWIIAGAAKRPHAWNEAFSTLTTIATHSQLFQLAELEVVDDESMLANEIGHGFFVVSYNDGEDY
jgi:hypothetical protein